MSGEDPFFTGVGGSGGEASEPAAVPAEYVDGAGSPPLVAYGVPPPGAAYDMGGGDGGDPFGGGGGGDHFGGGGEVDQFSGMPLQASTTPYQPKPTDPYSLQEAAAVLEGVQNEFDAVVKERADKEAALAAEVKQRAEEELDAFYDNRTDEVARRQARSREQEEVFLKDLAASIEGSDSNPWARICDLVDLKKPIISSKASSSSIGASGSGGGGGGGTGRKRADTGMDEENLYRATEKMRSLIIQMKADTAEGSAGDDTG